MIKYIEHQEIDFQKWDDCIEKSTSLVYPLSWYLNCVCPNWNAFILEKEGKYQAVFPLCIKKKIGFSYLFQPFFTQQLGYFSIEPNQEEFNNFCQLIAKKIPHIISNLSIENTEFIIKNEFFLTKKNSNCMLSLEKNYQEIYANYNSNRKRDLKKALKDALICSPSTEIELFIETFKKFRGNTISELKQYHYDIVFSIFKKGQNQQQAKLFIVKNKANEIQAGGLFIFTTKHVIFLMGCVTDEGKKNGAMTFLMDFSIQHFANTKKIFDFEGSNIQSIREYYKSFGATEFIYTTITDKKVYFLLENLKNIKKRLIFIK